MSDVTNSNTKTGIRRTLSSYRPTKKRPSMGADLILSYRFLKMLTTPVEKTDAYQLGIVDAKGKRIKRPSTAQERNSYGPLDRIIFKLQWLLSKTSEGKNRTRNYAAALWLIREFNGEEVVMSDREILEGIRREHDSLTENAPMNAVGGGHVTGLGIPEGPVGEPGIRRRKQRRRSAVIVDMLRRRG